MPKNISIYEHKQLQGSSLIRKKNANKTEKKMLWWSDKEGGG